MHFLISSASDTFCVFLERTSHVHTALPQPVGKGAKTCPFACQKKTVNQKFMFCRGALNGHSQPFLHGALRIFGC